MSPSMARALGRWVAKVFSAEDLIAAGHQPVGQQRLLDIADAIDLAGHPIAGLRHGLRGLGVGCVHVIHQRRGEQGSKLHAAKMAAKSTHVYSAVGPICGRASGSDSFVILLIAVETRITAGVYEPAKKTATAVPGIEQFATAVPRRGRVCWPKGSISTKGARSIPLCQRLPPSMLDPIPAD